MPQKHDGAAGWYRRKERCIGILDCLKDLYSQGLFFEQIQFQRLEDLAGNETLQATQFVALGQSVGTPPLQLVAHPGFKS